MGWRGRGAAAVLVTTRDHLVEVDDAAALFQRDPVAPLVVVGDPRREPAL
jgi:hypothetical protein